MPLSAAERHSRLEGVQDALRRVMSVVLPDSAEETPSIPADTPPVGPSALDRVRTALGRRTRQGVRALLIVALAAAGSLSVDYGVPLRGIALAGIAVLSLYSLAAGIQMNHARPHNPAEPYRIQAAALGLEALQESIQLASARATGEPNALGVHIAGDSPAALQWALRDQRRFDANGDAGSVGIVLTPSPEKPKAAGNFIGMAYEVTAQAPLNEVRCIGLPQGGFDCLPLVRWLAFRDVDDVRTDLWVFWLRDDVARRVSGER
jgi:hypothetical protein